MLRTSIESCIRRRRRNISRHFLLRFCCGILTSLRRRGFRLSVLFSFIRFVFFLGLTKATRDAPPSLWLSFLEAFLLQVVDVEPVVNDPVARDERGDVV